MKDRIKELRKNKKLTQAEFGKRIGVKGNTITTYENGSRVPSEAVIKSICRVFNVNEEWLRTGQGDPYIQLSRDEELAQFFGEVMKGEDPDFRRRLLSVMSRLTTDEWALLERMAWKLVDELQQDTGQEGNASGGEEGKKSRPPVRGRAPADHLIPRTNR